MRVLLVDDQVDGAYILARLLERHGCETRFTGDPFEALEIAAEFQPESACLDLGMPGMDGYTLARQLRRLPGLAKCRIVALSGYPPDQDRMAAAGIAMQLLKPVAPTVLSQALFEAQAGTSG
jgi:CheY-like chemotaxis protein